MSMMRASGAMPAITALQMATESLAVPKSVMKAMTGWCGAAIGDGASLTAGGLLHAARKSQVRSRETGLRDSGMVTPGWRFGLPSVKEQGRNRIATEKSMLGAPGRATRRRRRDDTRTGVLGDCGRDRGMAGWEGDERPRVRNAGGPGSWNPGSDRRRASFPNGGRFRGRRTGGRNPGCVCGSGDPRVDQQEAEEDITRGGHRGERVCESDTCVPRAAE